MGVPTKGKMIVYHSDCDDIISPLKHNGNHRCRYRCSEGYSQQFFSCGFCVFRSSSFWQKPRHKQHKVRDHKCEYNTNHINSLTMKKGGNEFLFIITLLKVKFGSLHRRLSHIDMSLPRLHFFVLIRLLVKGSVIGRKNEV